MFQCHQSLHVSTRSSPAPKPWLSTKSYHSLFYNPGPGKSIALDTLLTTGNYAFAISACSV